MRKSESSKYGADVDSTEARLLKEIEELRRQLQEREAAGHALPPAGALGLVVVTGWVTSRRFGRASP